MIRILKTLFTQAPASRTKPSEHSTQVASNILIMKIEDYIDSSNFFSDRATAISLVSLAIAIISLVIAVLGGNK